MRGDMARVDGRDQIRPHARGICGDETIPVAHRRLNHVRVLYGPIDIGIVERPLRIRAGDRLVEWDPVVARRMERNRRLELVMTRLAPLLRVPPLLALLENLDATRGGVTDTRGRGARGKRRRRTQNGNTRRNDSPHGDLLDRVRAQILYSPPA